MGAKRTACYTRIMQEDSVSTIAAYINEHPLAVLSTIEPSGTPHGTTLYAGSDAQLHVFFMTKRNTRKHENILSNPKVALTFSGEDHQTTLQLTGIASEVTVPDEGAVAFQVLGSIRHDSEDFRLPISKIEAGPYIVYRVDVNNALLTEYEHGNRVDGIVTIKYNR